MGTLKKLILVACAVFFFTSCEETYNDKLFWPGELSQEYGSYIKPYALDLTYSGEKLIGKTVDFKTEDSEKGMLTLNDIVPGEKETIIQVDLVEKETAYNFNGEVITATGATLKYTGSIHPKAMKLDLNVAMPQNQWLKTYGLSDFTKGRKLTIGTDKGEYVWKETNEILTGALYAQLDDVELNNAGSVLFLRMKLIQNALCYFLPQVINTVTLQPDGNVIADYTTSPIYINTIPINEINPDKDVLTIVMFVMKFMVGTLNANDINKAVTNREWATSPINLITWAENNGKITMKLNLPAIISQVTQNGATPIDPGLIGGITEAISKTDPVQLKKLLGTVNAILNNDLLGIVANMNDDSFRHVFRLLTEGIDFYISEEEGHTHLYLPKESTTPFIQLLPELMPVVQGLLPENMANNGTLKNLLSYLMGTGADSLPTVWNAANTINLGLDLIPQE